MSQERNSIIKKLSLRYGLLTGAISAVLSLVCWIINPVMQYTTTGISLLFLIVVIVLLVAFSLEIRKKIGGYWSFGEAFKSLFIMSVYISIVTIAFHYILFNFIDPTLSQTVTEAMSSKLEADLSKAGMSQDKIDEINKSIVGKFDANFKNEAINLGVGIIIYAVIDLIIAAIVKKQAPLVPITDEQDPTV